MSEKQNKGDRNKSQEEGMKMRWMKEKNYYLIDAILVIKIMPWQRCGSLSNIIVYFEEIISYLWGYILGLSRVKRMIARPSQHAFFYLFFELPIIIFAPLFIKLLNHFLCFDLPNIEWSKESFKKISGLK